MQDLSGIGHAGLVFKPTVGGGSELQLCTGTIGNFRDLAVRNLTASGDIEASTATKGLILKTPDGTKRYRITVDNAGALVSTLI